MLLLVGLGNPGSRYAEHRHNIGFMAVDEIVRRHGFGAPRKRFQGEVREGSLAGERVLALKPQTFMNESGRSVGEAARFYKIPPEGIVVFHDELDLAPGKLRVKRGGGLAGHNGLRSLAGQIGRDFRRVRLGVGHPGHKDRVTGHVLRGFSKADNAWLEPLIDAIAEAAPLLAKGDDAGFASKVALILKPPEHKPKPEEIPNN
ncbi:MAG: aminoacyl-tRNA hydrolase [Alphaproteobacteria bacterium]|nr:aminoacyl-tRNA hydrolase [Alphaproteobacteria bacterium]MDP6568098.1 aminoacyl-tRNA hydrolase [Alphaproteobacteria bacterium]MDP6813819.1 aminoacyl-tRNA hydrolase [Alphaproteobacteria bacterium]